MKKNQLLFAIALGATFAACSSEENFNIVENNPAVDAKLSIRPIVDVQIMLPSDNANTRMALGDGSRPAWSTNDKLGAAVIDVPTYTSQSDYATQLEAANGKAIGLYNVVESYGCNNAFSTTDGGKTWASDQPMVEGNYLFYAPYQAGLSTRTPLEVAVPRLQNASGIKTALADFYNGKNIVQVGYKFISGSEKQKPVVEMFNLFAYPKFTIKNNFNGYLFTNNNTTDAATQVYNGTMKVDSVQLVNISAKGTEKTDMVIGGKLVHSTVTNQPATDAAIDVATTPTTSAIMGLHKKDNGFTTDGAWNNLDFMLKTSTKEFLASSDKVVAGRHNLTGVITTLVVNQTVEQGKSIDIFAVMPACLFNYSNNMLAAKVYVTIGDAQYVISEGAFAASGADSQTASKTKLNASATKGYTFTAKENPGLTSMTFMAGQSLPAEALYVDGNEYKKKADGVGDNLFTIELKGGQPKKAAVSDEVQIALRTSATAGTGVSTTDELITMIKSQAPNGTAWSEGATTASTKGYSINQTNTVEINSALIDALATNNQLAGGSLAIATVVPISNDVTVTATTATTATFKSATGKTYTITLTGAVTTAAAGKYVIINSNSANSAAIAGAVVIVDGATWTIDTANPALKSLQIASTTNSEVTTGIAITAGNIHNNGTFTTTDATDAAITANAICNHGTMTVSGELKAAAGNMTLINDGIIKIGAGTAKFTVTNGTGVINQPEATASSNITIGAEAAQEMVYVTTTTLATAQITSAIAIPGVTAIEATDAATILRADIAKFGALKHIIIGTSGLTTTDVTGGNEYNLTGFTLTLKGNATWTGTVNKTTVKGVAIIKEVNTLTLTNIYVNGTTDSTGKIIANGTTGKWNGGSSK